MAEAERSPVIAFLATGAAAIGAVHQAGAADYLCTAGIDSPGFAPCKADVAFRLRFYLLDSPFAVSSHHQCVKTSSQRLRKRARNKK